MKIYQSKINKDGSLNIPKSLRSEVGIKTGDKLILSLSQNTLVIKKPKQK